MATATNRVKIVISSSFFYYITVYISENINEIILKKADNNGKLDCVLLHFKKVFYFYINESKYI